MRVLRFAMLATTALLIMGVAGYWILALMFSTPTWLSGEKAVDRLTQTRFPFEVKKIRAVSCFFVGGWLDIDDESEKYVTFDCDPVTVREWEAQKIIVRQPWTGEPSPWLFSGWSVAATPPSEACFAFTCNRARGWYFPPNRVLAIVAGGD